MFATTIYIICTFHSDKYIPVQCRYTIKQYYSTNYIPSLSSDPEFEPSSEPSISSSSSSSSCNEWFHGYLYCTVCSVWKLPVHPRRLAGDLHRTLWQHSPVSNGTFPGFQLRLFDCRNYLCINRKYFFLHQLLLKSMKIMYACNFIVQIISIGRK